MLASTAPSYMSLKIVPLSPLVAESVIPLRLWSMSVCASDVPIFPLTCVRMPFTSAVRFVMLPSLLLIRALSPFAVAPSCVIFPSALLIRAARPSAVAPSCVMLPSAFLISA